MRSFPTRLFTIAPLLALCAAVPARADKQLDAAVTRAEQQLSQGKPDEAVATLQKAAAKAKRDPEAQLALAGLLARLGKLDEASAALVKAGELAAGSPPAVRARVLSERSAFALRAGTVREALGLAQAAVEAAPAAESLAVLARAQARAGDPTARDTARRAVSAGATVAAAHLALCDALRGAWLAKESEAACRRALELSPRSVAAQTGLALSLAESGNAPLAVEAARAAVRADATSAEAQSAVALALLAQDPADKSSQSIAAAQQASFLEPKNAPAKLVVARVFESRGQLDQAATAYDQAAAADSTWGAPRIGALRLRFRQGDAGGALSGLRGLPDDLKRSGDADLLLGELLAQEGDPAGALSALARAASALPGRADVYSALGAAAYDAGELAQAADALGRAVALEPGNVEYRRRQASYLAADGRLDESVAVLKELTARPEGQTTTVLVELGGALRSFEPPRVADAVAAYQRALKLDPRSGEAALGIARAYRAGRQWERAVDAYERVSSVNRRLEGEAMLGAAWCFVHSGDDYKARFYTGLAARAGADVRALRAALSGPAGGGAADEVAERASGLDSKVAGDQVRAVRGLLRLGRPAVPALARALERKATSLPAREAIVDGFGRMGPAARDALPELERLIKAGAPAAPESPAQAAGHEREAKLIAAMGAAATAIRGK
ncbi:MAG TPA: tetratricopeptide repeat protein [Vicinamibacteria bacterium]|nr:tetratricopeptide repeat protein [Vicinamibacteria bacterium]